MPSDQPGSYLPENQTAKANPYAGFMSQNERAKDFSEFASASFEQRLLAFTMDMLLLGIWGRVLAALLGDSALNGVLGGFSGMIYFIVGHWKYQRTLGKHLLGLRTISIDPMEPLDASRVVLRELFGRSLSGGLLGIGYLVCLFNAERRTLHDYFGRSRVVSLKPVRETSMVAQAARGFASVVGIGLLAAAGFYYAIFYTTMPLERLQRSYYSKGVRLKGISGNVTSGFLIKQIDWEEDGERIELQNLFVDAEVSLATIIQRDSLHIRKLMIERAHAVVKRSAPEADSADESAPETTGVARRASADEASGLPISIDEIDLKNLTLSVDGKNIEVTRFFVAEFKTRAETLEIGRLYVDSPDVSLNLAGLSTAGPRFSLRSPAQLLVKRHLFPDLLKADLDLSLQVSGEWPEINVEAVAFQDKIRIHRRDESAEMSLHEWSPGHYLRGYWPVHRLSLKFQGRGDLKTMLLSTPLTGALHLQHIPFRLSDRQTILTVMAQGLRFEHQRGSYTGLLALHPMLMTRGGWMRLQSTLGMENEEEELAYLYYGRPSAELDELRRSRLRADLRFFREPLIGPNAIAQLEGWGLGPALPDQSPKPLPTNVLRGPTNEAVPEVPGSEDAE